MYQSSYRTPANRGTLLWNVSRIRNNLDQAMATMAAKTAAVRPVCALLNNYSIEMTAKDVPHLEEAADIIPQGTKIPVTFLPGETFEMRIAAAKRARDLGFLPIPHISARRLKSQQELEGFLARLQREVGTDHAFVVAGDPAQPMGPYGDALSIIRTGLLAKYGIRRIGISGYPEGHPDIGNEKLWQANRGKQAPRPERGPDLA